MRYRVQHVRLDGRHFIVKITSDGIHSIAERRRVYPDHPYLKHVANFPFWHHSHHKPRGPLVGRIIAEVAE